MNMLLHRKPRHAETSSAVAPFGINVAFSKGKKTRKRKQHQTAQVLLNELQQLLVVSNTFTFIRLNGPWWNPGETPVKPMGWWALLDTLGLPYNPLSQTCQSWSWSQWAQIRIKSQIHYLSWWILRWKSMIDNYLIIHLMKIYDWQCWRSLS